MLNDYFTSKNINYNLYSSYIIKQYIETNKTLKDYAALELIKNQTSKELLLILSSLLNKDNKKLSFNILYILITISEFDETEKIFSLDETICCNIASFLGNNKNDDIFLHNGILLIRNIIMNKNICDIFNKYKITKFFEEIYEKKLLDNKFMEYLCYSICTIIHYEMKKKEKEINISILLPCVKILATQIRPNYSANLLHKYIYYLYELTYTDNSEIYYEIINCKIHKDIMNIYPIIYEKKELLKQKYQEKILSNDEISKKEISKNLEDSESYYTSCLVILKTLGKLMHLDDDIITQTLLNSNIHNFLKDVLHSNDIRAIKNACFCLSNICGGICGHISYLLDNNCLYDLINISKNIYDAMEFSKEKNDYYSQLKDTFREINFVFATAIQNLLFEKVAPLAQCNNYTVVIILVKGLEYFSDFKNQDLIKLIIFALYKLISINYLLKDNICDIMEKYGLKESLEKLMLNKDWEVWMYVDALYNSIFGLI